MFCSFFLCCSLPFLLPLFLALFLFGSSPLSLFHSIYLPVCPLLAVLFSFQNKCERKPRAQTDLSERVAMAQDLPDQHQDTIKADFPEHLEESHGYYSKCYENFTTVPKVSTTSIQRIIFKSKNKIG